MNKGIKIGLALGLLLVIVVLVFFLTKGDKKENEGREINTEMLEFQSEEAVEETQKVINEILEEIDDKSTSELSYELGEVKEIVSLSEELDSEGNPIENVVKAVTAVSGTSLINTNTGMVIQDDGKLVDNAATPGNPEAPQQSYAIENEEQILDSSIRLDVRMDSFSPSTFRVKRGQLVSLVVSNVNEAVFYEIVVFEDPSLSGVMIDLAKGETRSISFNAPTKAGEYIFYSSSFNHRELGAVGKMIVE